MRLKKGRLVLVRWRDIVEIHRQIDPVRYGRVLPIVETVGRFVTISRGTFVVKPEWLLRKVRRHKYTGETGETVIFMPIGCIESIRALTVGAELYRNG